jgi:hypothetical protein
VGTGRGGGGALQQRVVALCEVVALRLQQLSRPRLCICQTAVRTHASWQERHQHGFNALKGCRLLPWQLLMQLLDSWANTFASGYCTCLACVCVACQLIRSKQVDLQHCAVHNFDVPHDCAGTCPSPPAQSQLQAPAERDQPAQEQYRKTVFKGSWSSTCGSTNSTHQRTGT